MKKRILSLLLTLVMILGMIPATTLTANAAGGSIYIGSVELYAGYYLEQDSYTPTSIKPADNYAYFNGTTLELHNFIRTGAILNADFDLVIRLFGYNKVRQVNCCILSNQLFVPHTFFDLVIDGNGMLSISGSYTGTMVKNLYVKSGNLEIATMEQAFYDSEYFDEITYPKNAIALCSQYEGGTWEPFDLDKVKDYDYQHVLIVSGASFGPQSPAMPEGKTSHDLGTVAALNYPISFRAMAIDVLRSNGCRQYEKLEVKNRAGQTVITKIKEADDRDMPFDMNELPAGQYTIEETVGIIDPDGKKQVTTTHSFYINWQPISAIKYVIAESTEPIAGTVNTAPTITIAPECHCKVSDYAEGYWLYYTKGLGWRRMEENTKFVADKDYAYYFAIETTDGHTFPADGGNVNGILQCDQGYFGADVNRVEGRDDVAEMMLYYQPCTYGAPLEFSEQTPVAEFTGGLYQMEGILGQEYLFRFNHKPLTDEQKAKGFTIERTLMVAVGSLTNFVHKVQNDTGTQPLSYNLTIDQAQTYVVTMAIILKKDGTTLQNKGGVYQIKVVAGGTPVIFTADSSNSFGGTVTVDIDAMAKKDANLKTALDNGTVKYQWYRDASQIPDANGQSYTFHADDVGKKIKVAVLYGNSGSISEPFTVTGTAPAFTQQPTGGSVAPGKTMTVKWATSFTPTKIVVDKYNFVGLASEYTTLSGTATSIALPANEYGYVIKAYYNDTDFITSNKFTVEEVETPADPEVTRLSGKNRVLTSFAVANQLKERMGVEKFETVVVAYGRNFPDALAGSYLAARKGAPILLTENGADNNVLTYLEENLVSGGKVYILGGTAAVSQSFEDSAKMKGYNVNRLKGKDRYLTNLEILKEAGMNGTDEILIATGTNFADSLSASATGLPIVLVGKTLTQAQKDFLATSSRKFVIIGGTGAVSEAVEAELAQIGTVERIKGKSRYETSVVIAERYFANPTAAILAYAQDFPDGLCGGPLAYKLGAPLILTSNTNYAAADAYIEGITSGAVTGGTARLTDKTVREIFDLEDDVEIPVN